MLRRRLCLSEKLLMMISSGAAPVLLLMLLNFNSVEATGNDKHTVQYGVDCSFPVHYPEFRCGENVQFSNDRQTLYKEYLNGCGRVYGAELCQEYEIERLEMSRRQPQSMVNYTKNGYELRKAPEKLWKLISKHWELNKNNWVMERWLEGSVYANHWDAPTYLVNVEDPEIAGDAGPDLQQSIWDATQDIIEEWTQMEQHPISLYGIRIYTEGAVHAPHADRLPLISSAVVCVENDVEEDWPIELYDRNGYAVNITMQPGDMLLYESSTIQGRPFPLKGHFHANLFIHFEPTGRPLNAVGNDWKNSLDDFYPPYLLPNSPESEVWEEYNEDGWRHLHSYLAHEAAAKNNLKELKKIARKDQGRLFVADENGWEPIHEAVRAGHKEAVQFLMDNGADMDARTHWGEGLSPLKIALRSHSDDHPVSQYLRELGALDLGPEL